MWDYCKGFEGYGVLLRGFIKGFSDSLYCFNDSSDSCQFYTETVILLKHCFLLYCSFLNRFLNRLSNTLH